MPQLFIVATPIGNREDITLRAIKTLESVDFIICEDTRHSGLLLSHLGIKKPLKSLHAKSSPAQLEKLVENIKSVKKIAYISDAGTPGISDPGFILIKKCIQNDIKIVPIPGPGAFLALLSAAGLPMNEFFFAGFIPHKKGRQTFIKSLENRDHTVVFYESVHRFPRLLDEVQEFLGPNRYMVVGRELTKIHEEIFRGTVSDAQLHFCTENIKGEFSIAIAPNNFNS